MFNEILFKDTHEILTLKQQHLKTTGEILPVDKKFFKQHTYRFCEVKKSRNLILWRSNQGSPTALVEYNKRLTYIPSPGK